MARVKKMVCHDCRNIFNRKPANGDRQVCWSCQSTRVTSLNDPVVPPPNAPAAAGMAARPSIPKPPPMPAAAAAPARPPVAGGGLTAEMLKAGRAALKTVVPVPKPLPGPAVSNIPLGVRMLVNDVKAPIIYTNNDPLKTGVVNMGVIEFQFIWRDAGNKKKFAYAMLPAIDLRAQLRNIAAGSINPIHDNFNSMFENRDRDLPQWRKVSAATPKIKVDYREYGWRRNMLPATQWAYYDNGQRKLYDPAMNTIVNDYLSKNFGGQVFCERLVIAETGEIFYTADHYASFFRYHPGTMQWHLYRSAAWDSDPAWDESYYAERRG